MRRIVIGSLFLAALTVGCDSPVGDFGGPTNAPGTLGISIRAGGFDPTFAFVRPGGEVTFTNRDDVVHQIASDPHPSHERLTALNSPVIAPGASFRLRMPSEETGWGYHDELKLDVSGFRGTISVCERISLFGCS